MKTIDKLIQKISSIDYKKDLIFIDRYDLIEELQKIKIEHEDELEDERATTLEEINEIRNKLKELKEELKVQLK